ncbi:MAG: single-stranded DNA-binding protein, partial [Candidatus Aminicenantes bacterium]|nr:single-stranded DNA-binding protein [Candidatus Aminicenantes bacterium]
DRDGEWQDEASFFNIVAWQKLAEFGAERLRKGTPVFLTGRLRSHSWRDEEENPHSIVEIQVRNLQILERTANAESPSSVEIDQEGEEELELGAVAA